MRPGGELWGFVAPDFFGKLGRLYVNSRKSSCPRPRRNHAHAPAARLLLRRQHGGDAGPAQSVQPPRGHLPDRPARRPLPLRHRRHQPAQPQLPMAAQLRGPARTRPDTVAAARAARARLREPAGDHGAGYDSTEDSDPYNANASTGGDTMGRGLFAFDAVSGSLVWSALPDCTGMSGACVKVAGLTRAIPRTLPCSTATATAIASASTSATSAATCGGPTSRLRPAMHRPTGP